MTLAKFTEEEFDDLVAALHYAMSNCPYEDPIYNRWEALADRLQNGAMADA